jgi:hypothetical protein
MYNYEEDEKRLEGTKIKGAGDMVLGNLSAGDLSTLAEILSR